MFKKNDLTNELDLQITSESLLSTLYLLIRCRP